MNRRYALLSGVMLLAGCRHRTQTFDASPDRFILEDHWSGWFFDRVIAKYTLPLHNPAPSLSRPDRPPNAVVGSESEPITILSHVAKVRPVSANAYIEYDVGENSLVHKREISVTVHWPTLYRRADDANSSTTETRTAPLDFEDIRNLLVDSNEFRVEHNEHYYGLLSSKEKKPYSSIRSSEIVVELEIIGPNPNGHWSKPLAFTNTRLLYSLAERAWTGLA